MNSVEAADGEGFHLGHRPTLDGLRGIAILLVLGVHIGDLWPGIGWRLRAGFLGVDIFFVLSGFLITSLLVEEYDRSGTINFRQFYRRRAYRLFPALWLVLLWSLIWTFASPWPTEPRSLEFEGLAAILTYLQNWFQILEPGNASAYGLGHLWSLAVEEQFYLLWPLLLFALLRLRRLSSQLSWVAALTAASTAYMAAVWLRLSDQELFPYISTPTRLSPLLVGAAGALALHRGWVPGRIWKPLGWISFVYLLWAVNNPSPVMGIPDYMFTGGFTLVAVAALLIIVGSLDPTAILSRLLSNNILRFFGTISYSLYLWHYPLISVFAGLMPNTSDDVIRLCLCYALSVAVATLSYYALERPIIRYGRLRGQRLKVNADRHLAGSSVDVVRASPTTNGWESELHHP